MVGSAPSGGRRCHRHRRGRCLRSGPEATPSVDAEGAAGAEASPTTYDQARRTGGGYRATVASPTRNRRARGPHLDWRPMTEYQLDARTVRITHPERVLFPEDGYTKADLASYHHAVAGAMLPHRRPPSCCSASPKGSAARASTRRRPGRGVASWIRTVEVPKEGGTVNHPVVDDEAALLALTNLSTVSFHRWPATADRLDRPDLLVIDLDPSTDDFDEVRRAARWSRELLDDLDLATYLQTTGSRDPRGGAARPLGGDGSGPPVRRRRGPAARRHPPRPPHRRLPQGFPGRTAVRRHRPERLRPDRDRPVLGATPPGRPGGGADHLGRAGRPRGSVRTAGTSGPCRSGWIGPATCGRACPPPTCAHTARRRRLDRLLGGVERRPG